MRPQPESLRDDAFLAHSLMVFESNWGGATSGGGGNGTHVSPSRTPGRRGDSPSPIPAGHGYLVPRFLAEAVGTCLEQVSDTIFRVVSHR
jgi:hypothetical protein